MADDFAEEDNVIGDEENQEPDEAAPEGFHVKKSSPGSARSLKPEAVAKVTKKQDKLAYLINLCGIDEPE